MRHLKPPSDPMLCFHPGTSASIDPNYTWPLGATAPSLIARLISISWLVVDFAVNFIGLGVDLSSPEIDRDYMGRLHGTMILFEDSLDDHVSAGTGKLD
jgi:hypothetical protein